jgi:BirA family biotin operon repressor/biotin-[acetyl-CoA-carboxylase] ligase
MNENKRDADPRGRGSDERRAEAVALSERDIREHLGGLPCTLKMYDTIDSTNNEAKRLISASPTPDDIPFGTVIIAGEQTAGRGRMGRFFASPRSDSLYVSFVLKPAAAVSDTLLVTIMAAVAVCEAIETVTGGKPQIKWVNDVYMEGRKVCGILTEAVAASGRAAIDGLALGVGVNINTSPCDFPEEIRETAGSVSMAPRDRGLFAAELIKSVLGGYEELMRGESPVPAYRSRSLVIGREVTLVERSGEETTATAEGIAEDGSLIVRYADGAKARINSGEISLRTKS